MVFFCGLFVSSSAPPLYPPQIQIHWIAERDPHPGLEGDIVTRAPLMTRSSLLLFPLFYVWLTVLFFMSFYYLIM